MCSRVALLPVNAETWKRIRRFRRVLHAARGVRSEESAVATAEIHAAYRALKRAKRAWIETGHGKMRVAVADAASHNQGKAVLEYIASAIGGVQTGGGVPFLR